jgi:hypothetical protein
LAYNYKKQCNLFKAKEFLCVWVVLLSAENVSLYALPSFEEFMELEVRVWRSQRVWGKELEMVLTWATISLIGTRWRDGLILKMN